MSKQTIKFTEPHLISGYPATESILVALSGGADSSALLHLAAQYGKRVGCPVLAAHVNHSIRGEEYNFEADRDEDFCRSLCSSLNIPLYVKKVDIPSLAKESGRSLETEAREARYSFFASLMQEQNIRILATAHNADDNVETQLFNFFRGCGIDGLVGIPEAREMAGVDGGRVVRPLLRAEKAEIIAYCEENGINYVTDSTNFEDDCTRNAIRHKIIPALLEIFPHAKRSAGKLALSAAQDSDFILCEAKKYLASHPRLDSAELLSLHPALCKRVIMLAFEESSDETLEHSHLDALLSLLTNQKNGASLSLPGKTKASVTDGGLSFSRDKKEAEQESAPYSHKLDLGLNIIENTSFAVLLTRNVDETPPQPDGYSLYASAAIRVADPDSLYARSRTPGACVKDGGVNKRIKKLMCDKKIPLNDRYTLPLIYEGERAAYIPLCAVNDASKPRGEKPSIKIQIFKKTSEAQENDKRR